MRKFEESRYWKISRQQELRVKRGDGGHLFLLSSRIVGDVLLPGVVREDEDSQYCLCYQNSSHQKTIHSKEEPAIVCDANQGCGGCDENDQAHGSKCEYEPVQKVGFALD